MVTMTASRGLAKPICRYDYTEWIDDDGYFYVKADGREWERASEITFYLAARRRTEKWLEANGYERRWAHAQLEVWDIAYDWADGLMRAVTYKSKVPLPVEDENDCETEQVA